MLIGYTDEWSLTPGATVDLKVSTDAGTFELDLVRLRHGDENPAGPGRRYSPVANPANGRHPGRLQETRPGSCVRSRSETTVGTGKGATLSIWVKPLLDRSDQRLVDVSGTAGDGLWLDQAAAGELVGTYRDRSGNQTTVRVPSGAEMGKWNLVHLSLSPDEMTLTSESDSRRHQASCEMGVATWAPVEAATLTVAASGSDRQHFNGRLERPRVYGRPLTNTEVLEASASMPAGAQIDWDFSLLPASNIVVDRTGGGVHGRCLNMPTRGVVGRLHRYGIPDADSDPAVFGAIHFHSDDLADAGWETSVRITLDDDLPSGVYAARLSTDTEEDFVPFFVRSDANPPAPVLVVIPTLTYMAYANEKALDTIDLVEGGVLGRDIEPSPLDHLSREHPEWGLSQYDLHADGSPVVYSSRRRPIPNLRPHYRHWTLGAPRGLSGDLYIIDWLEEMGFDFEVCTDEDLHRDGLTRLQRHKVMITATHPEYWTAPMLDAVDGFLATGGSTVNLGGNTYYAVTTLHPEAPWISEVRRHVAGTRPSQPDPWEARHVATGETGGIWRHRGRAPNLLTGLGFAAQGWDTEPRGFVRSPESYESRFAWLFDGIEDEVIGDFGLVMDSALGDEIDRADPHLGPDADLTVLATGRPSKWYLLASEDILITSPTITGEDNTDVRADIAFFETGHGGAVFSTGSISWAGALSHNDYDNNVSRLTANALRGLLGGPTARVGHNPPTEDRPGS